MGLEDFVSILTSSCISSVWYSDLQACGSCLDLTLFLTQVLMPLSHSLWRYHPQSFSVQENLWPNWGDNESFWRCSLEVEARQLLGEEAERTSLASPSSSPLWDESCRNPHRPPFHNSCYKHPLMVSVCSLICSSWFSSARQTLAKKVLVKLSSKGNQT